VISLTIDNHHEFNYLNQNNPMANFLKLILYVTFLTFVSACTTSLALSDRIKAKRGDTDAQVELARRYYYGDGTAQDDKKSIYWFEEAAKNGNPLAQEALARRYYHGGRGVSQDFTKAFLYATQAATGGRVGAMSMLGVMHCTGKGVTKNEAVCVEWYKRAAQGGDGPTQLALARKLASGRGVPIDLEAALFWYEKAAAQNLPDAGTELCSTLELVKQTQPDFNQYDGLCE